MRLSHQVFAISFVVSAVALSLVGFHTVDEVSKILNRQTLENLKSRVEREAHAFEDVVHTMNSDLALLASTDPVQKLSATWAPYARRSIERSVEGLFSSLISHRPFYAQLRLLDPVGRELVRINNGELGMEVVPADQRQDKSNHPYYEETVQLSSGEVYMSRLDLNKEKGAIVEPHQPVLRAATPVIAPDGLIMGVLVINLDVTRVISGLTTQGSTEEIVLLNTEGDYLVQKDASRTFGFEFDQKWRLPNDHDIVAAWDQWSAPNNQTMIAHFVTDSHLVALHKVRLRDEGVFTDEPNLVFGIRDSLDHFAVQRQSMEEHFWLTMGIVCVVLALILALVTHKITRPLKRLAETTKSITEGDQELRATVEGSLEIKRLARDFNNMLEALKRSAQNKQLTALGRMAAMVAHDLRNALTSVKVNLQVMARHQDIDDPMQAERFEIALEQVDMMEKVLQEILIFAKADALQRSVEDVSGIIRATMITVMPVTEERDITLKATGLESLPKFCCDRTKLIQVFRNLIDNAIAATEDGGCVTVQGDFRGNQDQGTIVVKVIDQGRGIDPDVQETLFEPFITTKPRGTGLGLAIVKRVIELHEGKVTIENGVKGAIATVTLPVRKVCEDDRETPNNPLGETKDEKTSQPPESEPAIAARTALRPAE